jgi:hypothetical protein
MFRRRRGERTEEVKGQRLKEKGRIAPLAVYLANRGGAFLLTLPFHLYPFTIFIVL